MSVTLTDGLLPRRSSVRPQRPHKSWILPNTAGSSQEFASRYAEGDPHAPYCKDVDSISVVILAHSFDWEGYHSDLNRAGSALAPSRSFSATFDLRSEPQSFEQRLPDGTSAALSLGPPRGLVGSLLYLGEDLALRYMVAWCGLLGVQGRCTRTCSMSRRTGSPS